jgi:hypothetical protein
MTPAKEKALELVDRFTFNCRECDFEDNAKQCALIAVDEIILEMDSIMLPNPFKQYWKEVKQEIENL